MFRHLFTTILRATAGRCLVACLSFCLVLLAFSSIRRPADKTPASGGNRVAPDPREQVVNQKGTTPAPRNLTGAAARKYLQEPGEGQSLMQAITTARFGLKSQERGPFGETGRGYLGMSHEQNLNAWFAEDGVTVRPTVSEEKRARAWHLDLRLKAYGYGNNLVAPPPIVAQHVKDNRIEYERGNVELRNANFELMKSDLSFTSQSAIRNPQFIEWYENRAEGIEQGFTLAARPERNVSAGNEPLRLLVTLNGDLTAQVRDAGQAIELKDHYGRVALSYGKLTALDANGKRLTGHMEASADGTEIALVVDDRGASYPIVIDPIVASLEKILDAGGFHHAASQFGDAAAIDGNNAVVGEWLDDVLGVDTGFVYFFSRTGSTWGLSNSQAGSGRPNEKCGYSVAISGNKAAYGCPGVDGGRAYVLDLGTSVLTELSPPAANRNPGDFFGASVAVSGNRIVVGAPLASVVNGIAGNHIGAVHLFQGNTWTDSASQFSSNEQFGTSVALSLNTLFVGAPAASSGAGRVVVLTLGGGGLNFQSSLTAGDGAAGDQFGTGVAVWINKAIIGAPGDDDKGPDAGAGYVFVLDSGNHWAQQQKLTASDGKANDIFSYNAVAIEGNTIVIGARRQDGTSFNPGDDRGAAYIFTFSGSAWVQQTKLERTFVGTSGDEFGTSVGISGNTVIVSAPHAAATDGTADTGTASIYHLDCVPPYGAFARSISYTLADSAKEDRTVCPGERLFFLILNINPANISYQWRRNGVDIPGATNSTYTIDNASVSDAGIYDVFVSNSCGGEFSSPASLSVHTFSLSPNQNFSASGSPGLIQVTCTGKCDFGAVSNSPFITITSGATGTAPANVGFNVAANTGPSQRSGTLTIAGQTFTVTQDGATLNAVQFNSANYNVQEDCTTVTVTVNRIGDTSGPASVDYHTSDVTATERKDYITALGSLRFAAGETSKSFAILINEDSFVEGNETFSISLSNPSGVTLGGPAIATVTITDDASEPAANSIDDPQTYVCQHYHDFLNRQPDASGLQFWTNQITSCGTDQACIETRRINVSASFFLSIEFQDTGYLVERIYKAAYGDAVGNSTFPSGHQLPVPVVRLNEFLSDTQEIGLGVIVGQGNWQQQIETNKQAFTAAFVQRAKFASAFPGSLTAAQFVDTLNGNAGSPLSAAERNQLVNDLSTNAKTRAQVLRAVAEDTDLNSAESNRAFVLMQYFGYLRRNPNDPQDSDHTGYDFWLTKLNQFNGNYVNAEMVKAFITSIEYRQRFGQQ